MWACGSKISLRMSQSQERARGSDFVLPYKFAPELPVSHHVLYSEGDPSPIWSLGLQGTIVDGKNDGGQSGEL